MYTYKAVVRKVIDGDTIDVLVDLGFSVYTEKRLRLAYINAPELSTEEGKASKAYLVEALPWGSAVSILTKKGPDLYNRWIAVVTYNGEVINDTLIQKGFAFYSDYK
jgi:micrococcal nuclease